MARLNLWFRSVAFTAALLCSVSVRAHHAEGFLETDIARPDGGAWQEAVGTTFQESGRTWVWERTGRVWIVDDVNPVPTPFLDISDEVGAWHDHGLLGFALDTKFEQNGYVYLMYLVDRHHMLNCNEPASGSGEPVCGPGYDPLADQYFEATIGRVTRYRADLPASATDYAAAASADRTTRKVLIGSTMSSGIPSTSRSHVTGSLVFGTDGTLLVSTGDGARSAQDSGSGSTAGDNLSYTLQALADGIIDSAEDVGANRAQMLDSLSGKVLRIDSETGDGLPSNPFFDAAAPASARSRVFALGLRNPYRATLWSDSGSHDPADGEPGRMMIGDVGRQVWEELNVLDVPGQNFGWPIYEGMRVLDANNFARGNLPNVFAPNSLFGTGGCNQEFFYFSDLLVQETQTTPSFPNPCNAAFEIATATPVHEHTRPILAWMHQGAVTETKGFDTAGNAIHYNLDDPDSPIGGQPFSGAAVTSGMFYRGSDLPPGFDGNFFFGDYVGQWIRRLVFDENGEPELVQVFSDGGEPGGVVHIASNPVSGGIYYIPWTIAVKRLDYAPDGTLPPEILLTSTALYGASPLTVDFDASGSSDPEGMPLTFGWDFGDGATGSGPTARHTFTAPGIASFAVELTATDNDGGVSRETVIVSPNNSPPQVSIISPVDMTAYSMSGDVGYDLLADIRDTEHPIGAIACEWQVRLHHNTHTHGGPPISGCTAQAIVSPAGCDGENYFWKIDLTVTDPASLTGSDTVVLQTPDCGSSALAPVANGDLAVVVAAGSVTIQVLQNDFDDNGLLPNSVLLSGMPPSHGNASVDPLTGDILYVHTSSAGSIDTLFYTVNDVDGLTSNTATVVVRSVVPDTDSPTQPANFSVVDTTNSQVSLDWTASSDNVGVAGYRLYRDNFLIADVSTTSFVDQGLPPATLFDYAVEAYDDAGNVSTQATTASTPLPVTVSTIADAYTRTNPTTNNFGDDTIIRVQPWAEMRGFVRFDLSSLPAGTPIASASLRLAVDDVKIAGNIDMSRVLANWSEQTLTRASEPPLSGAVTTFAVMPADVGDVIEVDVTGLVSGWLADPASNFGLALTETGANVWFDSREGGVAAQLLVIPSGPVPNQAPSVQAGSDQTVSLVAGASLSGSVTDDGLPNPPGTTTVTWTLQSGPAAVTFSDPTSLDTTAGFSQTGTYVLQLGASDGELGGNDTLTVNIFDSNANQRPVVAAGDDFSIAIDTAAALAGSFSDDGLPNPPGQLTTQWIQISGPGTANFDDASSATSSVTFNAAGEYVLRLSVSDGELQDTDDVTVSVFDPGAVRVIPTLADTYTRSNAASGNFGSENIVRVQPWGDMTGFVRFDLSQLVATGTVSSATLNLPVNDVNARGDVEVRRVLGDWSELTVTRNNQPLLGSPVAVFPVDNSDIGTRIDIDVTNLVNALLADAANDYGIALTQDGANIWLQSRESGIPITLTASPGGAPLSTFTDVTAASGTGGPGHFGGHGVQFADADGDGLGDFYVTMNETAFGDMAELYYRNVDGETFSEEAAARGVDNVDTGSHGGVFADFDNDGDFDLFNGSYDQNRIYRNDGNGNFEDRTVQAGLPARLWPTRGVAAFDMDLDGDLDIAGINGFLGSGDPPSERNEFYRNVGGFTFVAADEEPLFSAPAGQGITDTDYDNDGDIDLFAANRGGDVVILRNVAGTGFEIVAPANIGILHSAGDGISFGDANNDGFLDVLLDNEFYLADGDGTFTHRQTLDGPEIPYMGGFADLDNDGDLDVVIPGASFVYWNDGSGAFSASELFALGTIDDPRSVAFSDIDNDGDLDFYYAQKQTFNVLVRNNYAGNNRWLKILLHRASGQVGAFGSRVYVYEAGGLGDPLRLITWKEIRSQDGYLSQSDPRIVLGLAGNDSVDVRVVFPGGAEATVEGVPAGQSIEIQE